VVVALVAMVIAAQAPARAVSNDNFVDAVAIGGASGTVSGSSAGATKEAGEPDHAGNPGGSSIWYVWTAPSSGGFTFDTCGSGFDTVLAVYTGDTLATLTPVAAGDDDRVAVDHPLDG